MNRHAPLSFCCTLLFLVTCTGCGGEKSSGTLVKGTLTYNGNAVTYGSLIFFPAGNGKATGGPLKDDGTFEFLVEPGSYLVSVNAPVKPEGINVDSTKPGVEAAPSNNGWLVPERYARKENGIPVTITAGETQDLELKLP